MPAFGLVLMLLAVALTAGTSGFVASVVVSRRRRRARGFFALGFVCGMAAGAVPQVRRRSMRAIGSITRRRFRLEA